MNTSVAVSLERCPTYETARVEAAVRRALDLLGGIGAFVPPGARVLVKPNLLTDTAPEAGVTTHPEVVRAVLRCVKSVTPHVVCGDAPSVWGERKDVERVYAVTGMRRVCEEEGVAMVHFNTPRLRGSYPLTDQLDACERVISVPKFKTHGFTVLTAGVKNCYGFVVGMNKMKIHGDRPHPADLCAALVDIYEHCAPHLTVVDGITAMEGEGPGSSGTLRRLELVAASPDALAVDMVLAQIMGLEPQDIPTNREALRRRAAGAATPRIEVRGVAVDAFLVPDFALPRTTFFHRAPRWLLKFVRILLRMKPAIDAGKCRVCGVCRAACPAHAITQARRVTIEGKKCILCLCCQEVCPHGAVGLKKSLFLRMMR
ncbi:MAG: DUF362 domain-containing protein [Deltaproteobacteria bacterium]